MSDGEAHEQSSIEALIVKHQLPPREEMDTEDRIQLLQLRGLLPEDAIIGICVTPDGRGADLKLTHRVQGELVFICVDCGKDDHEYCWEKK